MANPTGKGGWQKGQSGNPKGRPPNSRALTELLEKAGSKTLDIDGKRIAGKRWLAQSVWQGITTGEVEFPGGKTLKLDPQDWLALMKWVYQHIDGPAKAQIEHSGTGEDGAIVITRVGMSMDDL